MAKLAITMVRPESIAGMMAQTQLVLALLPDEWSGVSFDIDTGSSLILYTFAGSDALNWSHILRPAADMLGVSRVMLEQNGRV